MLIEIQSLDKDEITGKITLVAAIRYPESVHIDVPRGATDEEQKEAKTRYEKLLAMHNAEHRKIKKLHLGNATLMQADGE